MLSIGFFFLVGILFIWRGYEIRKNNRYFNMTKETWGGFFTAVVWTYYVLGLILIMAGFATAFKVI